MKRLLPFLFVIALGCRSYEDRTPKSEPKQTYPSEVVKVADGVTISGRVIWKGELPVVPKIHGFLQIAERGVWGEVENPRKPSIDLETKGIGGVVVYLKRILGAPAKPWPYPPLRIRQELERLTAEAGGSLGFLRVGDELEFASNESETSAIRARRDAFFGLSFPPGEQIRKRKLTKAGFVEITSASGYFGSEVEIAVCDHPYFTATDSKGKFELTDVPPGEYELIVRLRNWNLKNAERDPETGKIARLNFDEPRIQTRMIRLESGKMPPVEFEFAPETRPAK